MKVALLCGGPSRERGISLNSARSVLDHLSAPDIEIVPIYFDAERTAYHISSAQLYSNTPSDFDFKLAQTARPLSTAGLVRLLKTTDIAWPAMHGPFGEDGGIQALLERHNIPFVGSGAAACKQAFDKFTAAAFLRERGFFAAPSALLKIYHRDHKKIIEQFFKEHHVKRAVVKPASGGSSIGVFSVATPAQALAKAELLFSKRMDTRVVLEPFAEGVEFTTIILENRFGLPVALPPTEIETDYTKHQIFDYRRKYLPTRQVTWHCPPRFSNTVIERIQAEAEQLFAAFGLHDVGRFDGWVLKDGRIWFCDFNTVSGMEQNSFLFQQASRVGLTHAQVLRNILRVAGERQGIHVPVAPVKKITKRKPVAVLFGGATSERQVSLMSGTNVWLKLRQSERYEPKPYLLAADGAVWELPYHLALNHTVEEITDNCRTYEQARQRLESFEARARLHLGLREEKDTADFFAPRRLPLAALLKQHRFIFNALHGGPGEDGTYQALFAQHRIKSNGPGAAASRLGMDKWATSRFVDNLHIPGVSGITGRVEKTKKLLTLPPAALEQYWQNLRRELATATVIVKPRADGCTTGVVHLYGAEDLAAYLRLLKHNTFTAAPATFRNQTEPVEMPTTCPGELLFERFIATDRLRVKNNRLKYQQLSGWVEVTVGVVERAGKLHVLNPSLTVAEGEVLSVEEKFQGGTGVNITPPPRAVMTSVTLKLVRQRIGKVATALGITGYSRIDAFVHAKTGDVLIIEVNTLPALTPSTVFYQQGLAERPAIFPRQLLEQFIQNKGY